MSFLHCGCSKGRVSESDGPRPYDRSTYTALPNDRAETPVKTDGMSSSESNSIAGLEFEPAAACYELYTTIGKGHNEAANINLAKHLTSGQLVAIKRICLETPGLDYNTLQNEIVLCQTLHHSKIIPHYCNFMYCQELWTVMPLMAFGSCRDLIHAYFSTGLSEQTIAYILRDILQALEYLHNRGIIHRSVKAAHILIGANGKVCLSGLQYAYSMIQGGKRYKTVHSYPDNAIQCLQWFSPEILKQNLAGYDTKSDIYSIGITACELGNGQTPFSDMPATQMLLEKLNGTKPILADSTTVADFIVEDDINGQTVNEETKAETAIFQRTFSQHFHNFVGLCLEKDPNLRPTATALLGHPFLKNLRKKTTDVLPGLLHPVTPLTDASRLPKDNSVTEQLTDQMSSVTMEDDWLF
ncbi:STE20-related kinase adapter protein alpha isoform X1 [Patella vulgata]|uniref:STE20-related kinase adapter protein alpha isoform X1 n=1 Tax=Patella vulgata TaxID=6465 RepID=UPI0021808666|nr:STE20-related kinase adapter protein alpha isoform X1 [Patella vulgata]